jgi:hypothetical protein
MTTSVEHVVERRDTLNQIGTAFITSSSWRSENVPERSETDYSCLIFWIDLHHQRVRWQTHYATDGPYHPEGQ